MSRGLRARSITARGGKVAAPVASEREIQGAVVAWFRSYAPTRGIDPNLLMASAGGAHFAGDARRRAIQARRLKESGYVPGTPDLFLAVPKIYDARSVGCVFHGLFIELKADKGRPSPAQLEQIDRLRRAGYNAVICNGYDDAVRAIRGYIET